MLAYHPIPRSGIYHNGRAKLYPNGDAYISIYSADIIRESGWEERGRKPGVKGSADSADLSRSKRRARSAVFDLAMANDFKYFVTLTLDKDRVDRYDSAAVTKKLNVWLDNQVRRKGLTYVLVPEFHKDGAIHFHGLFNDALAAVDSGTISMGSGKPRKPRSERQRAKWLSEGGHVVYNLPGWKLGFTTAIELYGERAKAVNYVCKYITKAADKVGGRWYYSGGELKRPETVVFDVEDFAAAAEGRDVFKIESLGCYGCAWLSEGGSSGWTK